MEREHAPPPRNWDWEIFREDDFFFFACKKYVGNIEERCGKYEQISGRYEEILGKNEEICERPSMVNSKTR